MSIIIFRVHVIGLNQKTRTRFFKAHLKKKIKPTKNPTLSFPFEKCTMKKSKISSILVQLTVNLFLMKQTNSNEI